MAVLKEHCKMDEDWEGDLYCGITLKWNNEKVNVDISMLDYVHKKLIEYICPQVSQTHTILSMFITTSAIRRRIKFDNSRGRITPSRRRRKEIHTTSIL